MGPFVRYAVLHFAWLSLATPAISQDSTVVVDSKIVTLKEVIVRSNLNVERFIRQVKEDTTFYKAFKNLRVLGYTSLNSISMFNKKGVPSASLTSKTVQHVKNNCRWTETVEETTTGDIYAKRTNRRNRPEAKAFNYYTAEMYAGLFFAKDTVCGESNIVAGTDFSGKGKSGLAKHKEQLKMLFFNPGKKIPGIPFIGNKIAIFDEPASDLYDFIIDIDERKGVMCYVFRIAPRADLTSVQKDDIVINEMTTWFDTKNWEIIARNYQLSYKAGVYDFDISMEVEMGRFNDLVVPVLLTYHGNWDVMFKKRENGVFTATLFDFKQ